MQLMWMICRGPFSTPFESRDSSRSRKNYQHHNKWEVVRPMVKPLFFAADSTVKNTGMDGVDG